MISAIQKLPDQSIQLTITIPQKEVEEAKEAVIEETIKNTELAGFRKGKAPKKLVLDKIDKEKVKEEVLKRLLPKYYVDAVKEHDIKPIVNPRIHISTVENDKDWQFTALTTQAPEVKLNDYKNAIGKVTARSKIIIPGKEPFGSFGGTQDKSAQGEPEKAKFEDIIKALLENVKVEIPKILVDAEVDKLLAQTLEDIKRLGLTLDQYLSSTGKTPDTLRAEYAQKAMSDLTLEFALQKVAETEHVTVEEKEIEEAIQKAKDPKERQHMEANRYLLAAILRQQKTLDFLKNL